MCDKITHHVVHESFKNNISNNTHNKAQGANAPSRPLNATLTSCFNFPNKDCDHASCRTQVTHPQKDLPALIQNGGVVHSILGSCDHEKSSHWFCFCLFMYVFARVHVCMHACVR